MLDVARRLRELGFRIVATHGTAAFLPRARRRGGRRQQGARRTPPLRRRASSTASSRSSSTRRRRGRRSATRSRIRRTALTKDMPYFTTMSAARAAALAIASLKRGRLGRALAAGVPFVNLQERIENKTWLTEDPDDSARRAAAQGRAEATAEVDRSPNVQGDRGGARPRRPVGERRVLTPPRRRRGSSKDASREIEAMLALAEVIDPGEAVGRQGRVRRDGEADRHRHGRRGDLHDRRRARGRHQEGAHQHLGAAGARAHRTRARATRSRCAPPRGSASTKSSTSPSKSSSSQVAALGGTSLPARAAVLELRAVRSAPRDPLRRAQTS